VLAAAAYVLLSSVFGFYLLSGGFGVRHYGCSCSRRYWSLWLNISPFHV